MTGESEVFGPFDVCGTLPGAGVTVLEASAGTGKTFTLTALVTRFVADGVPLDAILAVTFTRMATGELRDRVRQRLVSAEDRLGRFLHAGEPVPPDDEVVTHLTTGTRPTVESRHARLADAVAAFDAATIATTHGFCQLVIDGLASAGDVSAGASLLEDPADLLDEVVDDLYLRRVLRDGPLPFSRAVARTAAAEAVANPDIRLAPGGGEDPAGLLSRLAAATRLEVARRLQEHNLLTYDQLLVRLADTLEDPERGPLACGRLADRYRVVLVDEFQDTDPIQWRILRTAFGHGRTTLVLVGDPKQAIYSFRGADVHAYLQAAAQAETYTLTRNWRADQPLLDATDALFAPLQLGHERIRFRSVRAPDDRRESGARGFPDATPLRIRLVDSRQAGIQKTSSKQLLQKTALVTWIAQDAAVDIARLLASGAEVRGTPARPTGSGPTWRPLAPADIAVLTKTNRQSVAVRDALRAQGVPSVVSGLDSVFTSAGAQDWRRLLEALQEPASRSRAVAVALTAFVGMNATEAAMADERTWETVHARVHRWSAVLAAQGVAALYRSVTATEDLPARILATVGGERHLTDLGHVAQLLHAESAGGRLGAATLRAWLAERIDEAGADHAEAEERSRRLDSDAEAVQVLTVHGAKGLEFGVVYCPYLWDPSPTGKAPGPVVFHDPDDDVRTLDVGCPDREGPARERYEAHRLLAQSEQRGEDLRLMYVALTRARHQVVVWWGRADGCRRSPLGRLLLRRDPGTGAVGDPYPGEPKDTDIRGALEVLVARVRPGLIALEAARPEITGAPGSGRTAGAGEPVDLDAARFERNLDLRWRRASYTSITAAGHAGPGADTVSSEAEDGGVGDEPGQEAGGPGAGRAQPVAPVGDPAGSARTPSPWDAVPGGTEVGTFVHGVLERVDFAAPDLHAELESVVRARADSTGPAPGGPGLLLGALAGALTTPLGPLLPGTALRDVGRADRLDELGFELPLAGGDDPTGQVAIADIASLLAAYVEPGGPLAGYPARLADPALATGLRGYLTGSLDLVFHSPAAAPDHRWYVADYKTNWLGDDRGPLTAEHYGAAALDVEMQRRHYPLQALLYQVALHRYLRWRLPRYTPGRHLGGVLYLFLRGMVGPDTPVIGGRPCGVFSWAPPVELIVRLSDLLDTGRLES